MEYPPLINNTCFINVHQTHEQSHTVCSHYHYTLSYTVLCMRESSTSAVLLGARVGACSLFTHTCDSEHVYRTLANSPIARPKFDQRVTHKLLSQNVMNWRCLHTTHTSDVQDAPVEAVHPMTYRMNQDTMDESLTRDRVKATLCITIVNTFISNYSACNTVPRPSCTIYFTW